MNNQKRKTSPDLVIRYLWVEFLNPGDGIAFGDTVKTGAGGIQWENLASTAASTVKYSMNELGFPVNRKDLLDAEVIWEAEIDNLQIIRGSYLKSAKPGGYRAEIAYPNFFCNSGENNPLHSPKIPIGLDFGQPDFASPEIYIVSGHGGLGDVWGRTKNPDGKNQRDLGYFTLRLIDFPELRLLIVPACTQAAFARGEDWKIVFEKTGCFAMLGFDGKYLGDDPGANALHKFAEKIQFGETILSAWKSACSGLLWGAFFREGVEKFNLLKLMKADKSAFIDKKIIHCSYESSPREYESPVIAGYFVRAPTDSSDLEFQQFADSERSQKFIDIVRANEKSAYIAFSSPEWQFFLRPTEAGKFKKGDYLNVRFYLMRPDHPDEFSINTFVTVPESKAWQSWKNYAIAKLIGTREDIIQIEVLQECDFISLPMQLKSSAHDDIKKMLDGAMTTLVSFSIILGKKNPVEIDDKNAWSGNAVIDLRVLSFKFKG